MTTTKPKGKEEMAEMIISAVEEVMPMDNEDRESFQRDLMKMKQKNLSWMVEYVAEKENVFF